MGKKRSLIIACGVVIVICIIGKWFLTAPITEKFGVYVDIDDDDNIDSVICKYDIQTEGSRMLAFKFCTWASRYATHIHSGHYEVEKGEGTLSFVRKLRGGIQKPIRLTIPPVRTVDRLAGELGRKLMADSLDFIRVFQDSAVCARYGLDTATIICLFLPDTYEVYWNIPVERFMGKMQKNSYYFWRGKRENKAKEMGLTLEQVMTLASIIDEETADDGEKPMIAGMYLNRLRQGMPLQADPTIKFALKQFDLKRIYTKLTFVKSPYNTYRNTGLPPGPIRIPSVKGIDAVLNYAFHDYMYMCAKEDFSGRHNFAKTYAEHQRNAQKYAAALDARGIE